MPISKAATDLRALLKPVPPPMTQQGLAEALGVTQQAVSSWLRGVTRPNYETRMKIAELVGVPVEDWTTEGVPADESGPHVAADASATGTDGS